MPAREYLPALTTEEKGKRRQSRTLSRPNESPLLLSPVDGKKSSREKRGRSQLRWEKYTSRGYSLASLRVGDDAFVEERESTIFAQVECSQGGSKRLVRSGGVTLPFHEYGLPNVFAQSRGNTISGVESFKFGAQIRMTRSPKLLSSTRTVP